MTSRRFLACGYGLPTEKTLALCTVRHDGQVSVLGAVDGLHDPTWSVVDAGRQHAYVALEAVSGPGGARPGGSPLSD